MQDNVPEEKKIVPPERDEVVIKRIILKVGDSRRHITSRWKFILFAAILGGAIGVLYATLKAPVYTAESTFVLEEGTKPGSGLGQYSALASMAGIDVGSSSGLFQGDNIIQLYKSRLMIEQTLFSKAIFNNKSQLLIDRYIESNKLNEAWKDNPRLKDLSFSVPANKFTVEHDSVIGIIVNNLNKNYLTVDKPDKKLSMISIKVSSKDQLFAKAFAENMVSTVNSFYIKTKTKGIVQNVTLLRHQADSVRRALNSSIGGAASALDSDPNPDPSMHILRVPSQKRQIDVQASTAMYTEVIRNLEIAKSALQRETPLIQVIDEPKLPLPNNKSGRLKSLISGMLIGILISIIWVFTMKMYRGIMSN